MSTEEFFFGLIVLIVGITAVHFIVHFILGFAVRVLRGLRGENEDENLQEKKEV